MSKAKKLKKLIERVQVKYPDVGDSNMEKLAAHLRVYVADNNVSPDDLDVSIRSSVIGFRYVIHNIGEEPVWPGETIAEETPEVDQLEVLAMVLSALADQSLTLETTGLALDFINGELTVDKSAIYDGIKELYSEEGISLKDGVISVADIRVDLSALAGVAAAVIRSLKG